MVTKGKRGRGRGGRIVDVSPTKATTSLKDESELMDASTVAVNGDISLNGKYAINGTAAENEDTDSVIADDTEEKDKDCADKKTPVRTILKSTINRDSKVLMSSKSNKESLETTATAGTESDSSEIKFTFTLDDSDLAEFDTDDVDDGGINGKRYSKTCSDKDGTGERSAKEFKTPTGTAPAAAKSASSTKKSKRKFGLEYIMVIFDPSTGGASSMKIAPHECVLCLPKETFNATVLAKHIHSPQHLGKVMKLQCPELYRKHQECEDGAELHALLSTNIPVPTQPVKLLVVTESRSEETRDRILSTIVAEQKKSSVVLSSSPKSSEKDEDDLRSKLTSLRQKRALCQDNEGPSTPETKKAKYDKLINGADNLQNEGSCNVLIVGDGRVQDICAASPELTKISHVSCHPEARLEEILSSALVKMNSSYKVLVVVALLNDFVIEKNDGKSHLFMVNPRVEELCKTVSKFVIKVRSVNPTVRILFTIPHYIDFITYSKRIKMLSPNDFSRLEKFSSQIMSEFNQLYTDLRFLSKSMFCYNFNITLRDRSVASDSKKQSAAAQMQFRSGTFLDGFHLSRDGTHRVASDMCKKLYQMTTQGSRRTMNDGGCNVLMVGDNRVQDLCAANPELANMSYVICYPEAGLEEILSGALMKVNSSFKVLAVVALLNDFVIEKNDGKSHLYMVNPNIEELCRIVSKFIIKARSVNPNMRILFTIPHYVDFIKYSKRIKMLAQNDFNRLENFSSQVMNAFNQLYEELRHMSKSMFCYNISITLRDPSTVPDGKQNAASQMNFKTGTLLDGFHLSRDGNQKIAQDIFRKVQQMSNQVVGYTTKASKEGMIESWADCDNILIVGDHHTFKFQTASDTEMTKSVQLVTEKFAPMSVLLAKTDELLNEKVDIAIIVGFYREFATNVTNGQYTILEPKVPNHSELFAMLHRYTRKWQKSYPRLTVIFTIPQVVDFLKYNVSNNKGIYQSTEFVNEMNKYSHQFSINIMSFYKELRPAITLGSKSIWLYHITNALYDGFESLMPTLGDYNVVPMFPPNSTFDGFKPNKITATRMREDLLIYVSKIFRKHSVVKNKA